MVGLGERDVHGAPARSCAARDDEHAMMMMDILGKFGATARRALAENIL